MRTVTKFNADSDDLFVSVLSMEGTDLLFSTSLLLGYLVSRGFEDRQSSTSLVQV